MEAYTYKGISQGKYVEGEIEALNQDEASFKLKEQQIIITNLIKSKKKKGEKKEKSKRNFNFLKTICNHGKSWTSNFTGFSNVKRSIRRSSYKGSC